MAGKIPDEGHDWLLKMVAVCVLAVTPLCTQAGTASSTLSAQDTEFVSKAAQIGAQECADARHAVTMTRSDDVKKLAEMMLLDHTAANAALAGIVSSKGWTLTSPMQLPNGPSSNATFADAQFLANQIGAHKNAILLFESEVSRGEEVDLLAYARVTLPNLKHHLVMLQVLSDGLKVNP